jgi:methylenetetrahydrofolate dehydrogenase (NADP+)/methenyltetrahydrofolate cyclohydrolase
MDEKILDGKKVAAAVKQKVQSGVDFLGKQGITPQLTVILVGDDPASQVYVRSKERTCQRLGIESRTIRLNAQTSEQTLLQYIDELNADPGNHGILVQLPLPDSINEENILMAVDPRKDVDCFHPQNVGRLLSGNPYVLPCTPAGIMEILKYYEVPTAGRHAVIIGRSNIVGKPLAGLLVQKRDGANATVTIAHSRTKNLKELTAQADILIAAIGRANFVQADMVKEGAVVIDVGINRLPADNEKGYVLAGDVDFASVLPKASKITPVPGGVGPMTIAMLMQNTLTVAAAQNGISELPL